MTNEEINIAIAEVCGYEWVSNGWGCRFLGSPTERSFGSDTQSPLCEDAYDSVPNYCNDLNAMHEAEKTLSEEVRNHYIDLLGDIYLNSWEFATATSMQRAEAFLKTIGKWEEQ
jgi:hypothetical protein